MISLYFFQMLRTAVGGRWNRPMGWMFAALVVSSPAACSQDWLGTVGVPVVAATKSRAAKLQTAQREVPSADLTEPAGKSEPSSGPEGGGISNGTSAPEDVVSSPVPGAKSVGLTSPAGLPKSVKAEVDGTVAEMAEPPEINIEDDETKDTERDVEVTGGETYRLPAGKTIRNLTVALGKAKVEGRVLGDVVVVGGKLTLVGTVEGSIQCVGGHVTLGSKSTVEGDVAGFGTLDRHKGSVIHGREVMKWTPSVREVVQQKPEDWLSRLGPTSQAFWTHHILPGRPLSFHVGWPWVVLLTVVLIQALLVWLVPGAVRSTAAVLQERPAATLLMGLLSLPLLLMLGSLALATIVGFPFFLIAGLIGTLIGKVALEVELGGKLLSLAGLGGAVREPWEQTESTGRSPSIWLTFLVGGLIVAALYLVPYLGITLWGGLTLWGIGAVVLTVFSRGRGRGLPGTSPDGKSAGPSGGFGNPTTTPEAPVAAAPLAAGASSALAVQVPSSPPVLPSDPPMAPSTPTSSESSATGWPVSADVAGMSPALPSGITPTPAEAVSGAVAAGVAASTSASMVSSGPTGALPWNGSPAPQPRPETSAGGSGPGMSTSSTSNSWSRPVSPPSEPWLQTRVGLGPRMLALLIDGVVLVVAAEILPNWLHLIPKADALGVMLYFVGCWVWRETSIGGLVLGLRIVRLDGRPLDWQVALVRSLSSFLSLFSAGLGQFWCAWDPEQQTWQDKLTGTVVVKESKPRTLI